MSKLKRREFLKIAGGTVAAYSMPISLHAKSEAKGDHKALVIVDLAGGNDSLNMFIPSDEKDITAYPAYKASRVEKITVKNNDLTDALGDKDTLTLSLGKENPYYANSLSEAYRKGFYKHLGAFDGKIATNALMPEIAHLMNRGKGAIVYNVGNIIKEATKEELKNKTVKIPTSFNSHVDAQKYIASGVSSSLTLSSGWLGALADKWQISDNEGVNGKSIYEMNMNLSKFGSSPMFFSNSAKSINIDPNGPALFRGYKDETEKEVYEETLKIERRDLFKRLYTQSRRQAIRETIETTVDWKNITGDADPFKGLTNAYGQKLFELPKAGVLGVSPVFTSYIKQFEAAARLIAIGEKKGLKRQVIMIRLGGWDTHTNADIYHARNLRGLSLGVGAFQIAIDSLGLSNNVTLASVSEFGRTTASNDTGTDHGWGASQFVIGNAVKGGGYGKLADFTLGGSDDLSTKGSVIPTTSFSQYYATLARWFAKGIDEDIDETLASILPELKNFNKDNSKSKTDERDLGFMKT